MARDSYLIKELYVRMLKYGGVVVWTSSNVFQLRYKWGTTSLTEWNTSKAGLLGGLLYR